MLDMRKEQSVYGDRDVAGNAEDESVELLREPMRDSLWLRFPIARAWILLVGLGMLGLGAVGFIPAFAHAGSIFNLFAIDSFDSYLHVITGIVCLAVFATRSDRYALWLTVVLMFVYIAIFTTGNIAFGNGADSSTVSSQLIGGIVAFREIPEIAANGAHVTVATLSLFIWAAVGIQQGALASARYQSQRILTYRSRTRIRSASAR